LTKRENGHHPIDIRVLSPIISHCRVGYGGPRGIIIRVGGRDGRVGYGEGQNAAHDIIAQVAAHSFRAVGARDARQERFR
jgi:hypothetical protein